MWPGAGGEAAGVTPQALFAEYNRRYWGGRLPAYSVRRVSLPDGIVGHCDVKRRIIFLSTAPTLSVAETERVFAGESIKKKWKKATQPMNRHERRVLLHEMCHAAVRSGCLSAHNARWRREMERLADAGETWARQAAAEYRTPGGYDPKRSTLRALAKAFSVPTTLIVIQPTPRAMQKVERRSPLDPAYRREHRIDPFWGVEDEEEHHPYMMGRPSRRARSIAREKETRP
jgi:SprT-like family